MTQQNNTPAQQQKPKSMANFLALPATSNFLEDTLGEKKAEFVSNMIALTDNDANLANCDPAKLMKVAINATALNLTLNKSIGHAYCVAYKNKNQEYIPQFIIGYKGYIQLAMRSGMYEYINACEVREGEMTRNKFNGKVSFLGDFPDNKVVGYVAVLETLAGFKASFYMTVEKMEEYALKYSSAYQSDKKYNSHRSLWSDPAEREKMACKTVLRQLLSTYGMFSTEIQQAMASDYSGEEEPYQKQAARTVEDAEVIAQPEPGEDPVAQDQAPQKVKL